MGYRLNRLDEPVFIAVSKPLLTEFGIHHRLESCAILLHPFFPTSYICNFRYVCQLAFRNSAFESRAAGLAIFLSERAAQKKSCLDTKTFLKNGKKGLKGGQQSGISGRLMNR